MARMVVGGTVLPLPVVVVVLTAAPAAEAALDAVGIVCSFTDLILCFKYGHGNREINPVFVDLFK